MFPHASLLQVTLGLMFASALLGAPAKAPQREGLTHVTCLP